MVVEQYSAVNERRAVAGQPMKARKRNTFRSKLNRPPEGASFVWFTREMLESPAYRALGIASYRVLAFICLEHMKHGGAENGRLWAPYNQLVGFGVTKCQISSAIEELCSLGWIAVEKGERLGGRNSGSRYALTWLPTHDGTRATNRWRFVTERSIQKFKSDRRTKNALRRSRKRGVASRLTIGSVSPKILEAVRNLEPET